jgi:hypothetical protein
VSRHFWAMTTTGPGAGAGPDYAKRDRYARNTQAQLYAQGRADLHIFEDAHCHGQAWNFLRALRAGVASGADRITLLEDDLELCAGFVARVDAQPVPDGCAFISWFDPFLNQPRSVLGAAGGIVNQPKEPIAPGLVGFVRRICSMFYCCQALTFTRESALEIIHSPIAAFWPTPNEGDMLIAQVFRHRDYAVHVPALVQHVGELSLCNPGTPLKANRISHHYAGRDFDARTLPVFP